MILLILPTLKYKNSQIKKIIDYRKYTFYNNLVLSNTRIANLFNFPTINTKKNYWLSFSIFCKEKKDQTLLSIAQEIEHVIYD